MLIFLDLGFLLLAEKDFSRWLRRTRGRDAWSPFLEENLTQLWADFKGSWCSPRLKCIVHGNTNVNETTIHTFATSFEAAMMKISFVRSYFSPCYLSLKIITNTKLWTNFTLSFPIVLCLIFKQKGWVIFFYFIPELLVPVHFLKCEMRSWSQIRLGAKMEIASKLRDNIWEFSWRRTGMKS